MREPKYHITRDGRKTLTITGRLDCGREDCPDSANYKPNKKSSGSSGS